MEDKKLKRNIVLSYIISSLMWGRFFIPVLALFYIASQVSLEQFTIIMAIFSFTTLILEIPTGVIADLLGKKKTLLISRACYIIEIFLIAFFNGFWVFLIAKVISGVGVSLSSGTDSSFLYDTLKRLKIEDQYKKISGKKGFITNVSMAFTFIIGAYLFTINNKLPAIVSLPFIVLGFILTFYLSEPYPPAKKLNFENSLKHLKEGISYFIRNKSLIYLAMITFSVGSAISMMLSLSSAYFKEILIPVSLIGAVSFIGSILTAYTAKRAHKIESSLGEKKSLFIIQFAIFFSIILMSFIFPYYGLIFYLLIPLTQGFFDVIIGDYVNKHIASSHRATMLSINNMSDNIGIFLIFPLLGNLTKTYSMSLAYLRFSFLLFIFFLIIFIYYKVKLDKR